MFTVETAREDSIQLQREVKGEVCQSPPGAPHCPTPTRAQDDLQWPTGAPTDQTVTETQVCAQLEYWITQFEGFVKSHCNYLILYYKLQYFCTKPL